MINDYHLLELKGSKTIFVKADFPWCYFVRIKVSVYLLVYTNFTPNYICD